MIQRFEDGTWPGVDVLRYKDEPGTWIGTSKRVLAQGSQTQFETRYFEIEPGGFTSFEKHAHEHVVVVLKGRGDIKLDGATHPLAINDCVHVSAWQPHQFFNSGTEAFGILCIVDKERDRPVPVEQHD
jgi:mannose-6-phosphate isomerase-like protein (cupin superfamily)